jgi:lipopolysaccharide export system protein LptA
MTPWQRRARSAIAIVAVAFAIVVLFALKRRPQAPAQSAARTDPGAVVEVTGGRVERFKLSREDVRVAYGRQLTYENGSTKLMDVTISADERGPQRGSRAGDPERAGGRSFTVTGNEANVGQNESTLQMNGHVQLAASDGMTARTEHATYSDKDGVVRAMGPVEFSRGRMTGSGMGMTYDTMRDVLVILDRTIVHVAPDERGAGAVEVASGTAAFARREKTIRFERDVKLHRGGQLLEADAAVAYLTADEKQIESMELRGRSRITKEKPAAGGLQELTGRDMDLKYAADGQSLEHAVLRGDGTILLAGSPGAAGRQITASTIDVTLAPDGATPVALAARESVVLTLPPERGVPARTIRSAAMDGKGEPGRGLTQARFTGDVEFRERGPGGSEENVVDRVARAATLDVALKPAMAGIQDARFSHGVRFFEGAEGGFDNRCAAGQSSRFQMCAAAIRYDLDKGVLALTGSEPGFVRPRVVNDRIAIDATRIDVTLAGPDVQAAGAVKSVVAAGRGGGSKSDTRLPSMFRQDRPVNVTADALDYSGAASKANYTGNAQLWQDETSVKAPTINLDDKSGDLTASGNVTTVTVRDSISKDKKKERIRSIATAADFRYEESAHRATYTGKAHMNSPDGDMTAEKIELYLKPAGKAGAGASDENDLDHVEAYDTVTLRDKNRTTTGTRLTYTTADGRYFVTGAPVKVLDECGRETTGRTLTYLKSSDTITIDGNEQTRTQTKGVAQCP